MNAVWLTARGAGLSALVLLTIATSLGALVSAGGRGTGRVLVQYVHRAAGALGLGVLVLHVGTILADSYAHVGVLGAVVPFTAGYRATWVGLGTIGAYMLLLAGALGFARGRMAASRLGAAIWRPLHALGYAAWGFAMVHGLMSGTDSSVGWVRLLYAACGAAVVGALTVRLLGRAAPAAPTGRGGTRAGAGPARHIPTSTAPRRVLQEASR
jgi:methionine sulfoxide reductase heme-binding subunit